MMGNSIWVHAQHYQYIQAYWITSLIFASEIHKMYCKMYCTQTFHDSVVVTAVK